jgi:squalene-hopene/tetraprenyl-beta-curcumene cyclase
VFLQRCQNFDPQHPDREDGGFFFSTTQADTNKAAADGQYVRSYGAATADGILALLAVGSPLKDPRLLAARRWLMNHHRDMAVPGFVADTYQRSPQGLAFYYAAASDEAFRALGIGAGPRVTDALKRTQRADGSWANPEKLVKEDDPLMATAFAVRELSEK